jgi:hypothetical protein
MSQIQSQITFSDSGPNALVNAERLGDHVNQAELLNGAVLDQTEKASPSVNDFVLLGDPLNADSASPNKATLGKLMPDAIRWGQNQHANDTGAANAYVITFANPAPLAYTLGMRLTFKAANSNTGASTLNVNSLGTIALVTVTGAALASGNISAGQIVIVVYDGTNFQVLNVTSSGTITSSQLAEAARNSSNQYAADSGTANVYAVSLTPAATSYMGGMVVRFKAGNANTGGATLNVNALGAKSVLKNGASALVAGDIVANQMCVCVYDGTNFQMVSPVGTNSAPAWSRVGTFSTIGAGSLTVAFTSATPGNTTNYALTFAFSSSTIGGAGLEVTAKTANGFTVLNSGAGVTVPWFYMALPYN